VGDKLFAAIKDQISLMRERLAPSRKSELDLNMVLEQVQEDIANNGPGENYARAYRAAERGYWAHIPQWIAEMPSGMQTLDVGGAYGTLAVFTKRVCKARVTVVDAVSFYHPARLFEVEGVPHVTRDVEREAISDLGTFDLIIFTEILEHLNFKPENTLSKLKNALKPEGILLLSTPDASSKWGRWTKYYSNLEDIPEPDLNKPWIDDHIWQYTADELKDLLMRCGFQLKDLAISPGNDGYTHLNARAVKPG
jgi:2-polyprenyl-3-methyl-5-hydroxy-6-metoxy-1,4-benzoquinol methylase